MSSRIRADRAQLLRLAEQVASAARRIETHGIAGSGRTTPLQTAEIVRGLSDDARHRDGAGWCELVMALDGLERALLGAQTVETGRDVLEVADLKRVNGLLKRARAVMVAAALGSAMIGTAAAAQNDPCSLSGGVFTCQGNQAGGVLQTGGNGLNVINITQNIVPAAGARGVFYSSNGGAGSTGSSPTVGNGGGGGGGGTGISTFVNVDTSPYGIVTNGTFAIGLQASSNGGSGGNGGNGSVIGTSGGSLSATGGNGGRGGNGGFIEITFDGEIETNGSNAYGIYGSSSGGNGGRGGNGAGIVGKGGNGGRGGDGGFLSIANNGSISTLGQVSHGIYGFSAGGNGGNGGNGAGAEGEGGNGGGGGAGGSVNITHDGTIITAGNSSQGIFGHSIGGAGGSGGSGSGIVGSGGDGAGTSNGGSVNILSRGSITTSGTAAAGIAALSVGGYGGSGGSGSGLFAYGGGGAGAGSGGTIIVFNEGRIDTSGTGSYGIIAQSVGGGGGWGGSGSGLVGLGSTGGVGGSGGRIEVFNDGMIVTTGSGAGGILVQSIGGGGGDGGTGSGLVSIGGRGGGGGNANFALGQNFGTILTSGANAHGLLVQSIGGGGGNGGNAGGVAAIGGAGGSGGFSLGAEGANFGFIQTESVNSAGLMVQSIGGGGGNGGSAVAGGVFASAAIGGSGGNGGSAGNVWVNRGTDQTLADASIYTRGDRSDGIIAQSIGGGGGNGGYAASAAIGPSFAAAVALGGSGGLGGWGGNVNVMYKGFVLTEGDNARGIFAQSIGGGGGNGGFSVAVAASDQVALTASVGGSGGGGGSAGSVTVRSWAHVLTLGDHSTGIFAQSIGGGGGNGGFSVAGSVGGSWGGALTIGGSGAAGGAGGVVSLINEGSVFTSGAFSHGMMAQSIGGGGGNGGMAISGALSTGVGLSIGIGGSGGGGTTAGTVTLSSTGNVLTQGDQSFALIAQSLGGGGGNGGLAGALAGGMGALGLTLGGAGSNGGSAGNVTLTALGDLETLGAGSHAIVAQSIGGGGGTGGASLNLVGASKAALNVGLGGDGGAGSEGGTVEVSHEGSIWTRGDKAFGILAQSIGGGGGDGGMSLAGNFSVGNGGIGVSLGGDSGSGGIGRNVSVSLEGDIWTEGAGSHAIVAQSIGGGGGTGGIAGAATLTGPGVAASFSLGGFGDAGGNAGAVSVNHSGFITTSGAVSHGVLAQSIGGGGGDGGFALTLAGASGQSAISGSVGGFGGTGGTGGSVSVSTDGQILTLGAASYGVLAQSIGGGGGNGAFSGALAAGGGQTGNVSLTLGGIGGQGGTGGLVTLANAANVFTHGDFSTALIAQSIGGGGGNGGFTVSASGANQNAFAFGVGGAGNVGGISGIVDVINTGHLYTEGLRASALVAQSIGGGGGNGGFALSGTLSVRGGSLSGTLGGFGGQGGSAGSVGVDHAASILTKGDGAHGIMAQSVGGGGGSGGFAGSVSTNFDGQGTVGLTVGGFGDTGGDGGIVNVIVRATDGQDDAILTEGHGANAIMAQSIGGGGGDGGFAFTAGLAFNQDSTNVGVTLGGFGGDGGDGRRVTVLNDLQLYTKGDNASGILAQSIGGGGGTGGIAVTGVLSPGTGARQLGFALGGFGGDGGDAGLVSITNNALIRTDGMFSSGIFAQSIGGGGGNGGLAFSGSFVGGDSKQLNFTMGGFGGIGGHGGEVSVTNRGVIGTFGAHSTAILAQSIGGGGGNGGYAIGAALGLSGTDANVNIGVAVGGEGGTGGLGGLVGVSNWADLYTEGTESYGIFAQSIGGGGGNGGGSFSGVLGVSSVDESQTKTRTVNMSVSVGGAGGSGNHAGQIEIENVGGVMTLGHGAHGIFAQSIGGGGGNGGNANNISVIFGAACGLPVVCSVDNSSRNLNLSATVGGQGGAGGNGEAVSITNSGLIVTRGADANGIFAQSIGGGGGTGGNGVIGSGGLLDVPVELGFVPVGQVPIWRSIQVAVGGSGGASGDGARVDITNSGDIGTEGVNSAGIFAQSIGGGGGVGGRGVVGATGTIGIGGEGGAAGNGGAVVIANSGTIVTEAHGSFGIFAQSIGGGGGMAGNVDRALANPVSAGPVSIPGVNMGINLAFLRPGGNGGDGGAVSITNSGNIITRGDAAIGIFAQSVGGGGGMMGSTGNDLPILGSITGFLGSVGGNGSAAGVSVNQTGTIWTQGYGAHGILAQSAGGQGRGGDVNVTINGNVVVDGEADGVIVQSVGFGGNGDSRVELTAGQIVGGVGGAGVRILDGGRNTVVNGGLITTRDGIDGMAIQGGVGSDIVRNAGTLVGSIDLGGGLNEIVNQVSGRVLSGDLIHVGAGNLLLNHGIFAPGGSATLRITQMVGNYVQSGTGTFLSDLDFARTLAGNEADRLNITGSAEVGGRVMLEVRNVGRILPGSHSVTLMTASDGLTRNDLRLTAPRSAVAGFVLAQPDANTLNLDYEVDFAVNGLNRNQTSTGNHINAIQLAGGNPAFDPLIEALFWMPERDMVAAAYDQFTPQPYLAEVVRTVEAQQRFDDAMFSCSAEAGHVYPGQENACAWVRYDARSGSADATFERLSQEEDTVLLAGGLERGVGGGWRLGSAIAFERSRQSFGDNVSMETRRHMLGGVLKYVGGPIDTAFTVSLGRTETDTERLITVPAPALARGQQQADLVAVGVRTSRTFGDARAWWRPGVEVSGTFVSIDAFEERGAGPLNLDIEARDETFWRVRPSVEIGTELGHDEGRVRLSGRLGVSHLVEGHDTSLMGRFEGAPASAGLFETWYQSDRTMGELGLNAEITNGRGVALRAGYSGQFGRSSDNHGLSLKAVIAF
ncbi:MAG: hypothetical protein ACK4E3_01525 [Brevundimonas sp.]|uniref:hypothetical protein n=1 Tax=Brevundimonas sp. TaxID=1871086 RepID=UPI0039195CD8